MIRREQLLAALAEGDATVVELMARLPADQKWTLSVLRVNLTDGINAGQIWISHEGTFRAHDLRIYTSDQTRSVAVKKRMPAVPNHSAGLSAIEFAIRNRTNLEKIWSMGAR